MADMRLFHHFLITAYPHLPVGADKIWITVIPSFAHNVCLASYLARQQGLKLLKTEPTSRRRLTQAVRISHTFNSRAGRIASECCI